MLAGNNAGKLPPPTRKLGKWLWPTTAAALVAGTVWGVDHIEDQLERSAPGIVKRAGLDPSSLQFDASFRNVEVTGTLPRNTSAKHLEKVLATYSGVNGESIRKATVFATRPAAVKTEPVAIQDTREIQPEDVIVSAVTDGEKLTLTGMVPTTQHAKVLNDAALHSFDAGNIINTLTVTGQPAAIANAEQRINDFASVLSNLEDDVHDAQIELDNNIISGNITTTDIDMLHKIKAVVPDSLINVKTEHEVIPVVTKDLPKDTVPIASKDTVNFVPADTASIEPKDTAPFVPKDTAPFVPKDTAPFVPTDIPATVNALPDNTLPNAVIPAELITDEAVPDYRPTDSIASLQDEFNQLAESIREFVVFAPSSDVLQPSATGTLDDIVAALELFPEVLIEIAGHTDSHSSATYNQDLSQKRAQAVADYLVEQGISRSRLKPNGYGESHPIASNDTADGRARNRRVEFWAF